MNVEEVSPLNTLPGNFARVVAFASARQLPISILTIDGLLSVDTHQYVETVGMDMITHLTLAASRGCPIRIILWGEDEHFSRTLELLRMRIPSKDMGCIITNSNNAREQIAPFIVAGEDPHVEKTASATLVSAALDWEEQELFTVISEDNSRPIFVEQLRYFEQTWREARRIARDRLCPRLATLAHNYYAGRRRKGA